MNGFTHPTRSNRPRLEACSSPSLPALRATVDARTPAETSWLLAGAVATGLAALVLTEQVLVDAERLSLVFNSLRLALSGGAAAALIVGWLRPAPWLLALLLVAILSAIWFFAVSRFLRVDAWGEP
jgi:hypothetical protein